MQVLLADDDADLRKLLKLNLERWGYDVVVAEDGEQAWQCLQEEGAPRVAILDWMMPGLDGVEVCRRLRAQPNDGEYRYVMLLTAKTQRDDLIKAFDAGADDYVTKPFHPMELRARLEAGVRGRTRDAEATTSRDSKKASLGPDSVDLVGGLVAGKYRVVSPIGSGGMGTVWAADHEALGTRVAIKFLKAQFTKDPVHLARFKSEAQLAAKLDTPYAVRILDFGINSADMAYLVMEYLEGETLWDRVMDRGPLTAEQTAQVIRDAAAGLHAAHALGVVHRDVKPDNLLMVKVPHRRDTNFPYLTKLIDFGLARHLSETSPDAPPPTKAGVLVGTPNFMTPEYLTDNKTPNAAADLWALSTCAFLALTGRVPFDGASLAQVVFNVVLRPRPVPTQINPDIPKGFDEWFARACSQRPEHRFHTPQALADSLALALTY